MVPAQGVLMTAGMFRMLGRAPIVGRLFDANDGLDAIVISHAFWQRQFGGDPNVIGRSVGDGRRSLTIVGVMPPEFLFPYPSMLRAPVTFTASSDVDFWAELSNMVAADRAFLDRNTRLIAVVARLKDGVGLDAARADVDVAWRRLAQAYPDANGGWEAEVVPLHEQAVGGVRTQLLLLLGSVAIVLIVACVNVANLLLGRGVARQRELALRSALGAGRGRLLQQVVIETGDVVDARRARRHRDRAMDHAAAGGVGARRHAATRRSVDELDRGGVCGRRSPPSAASSSASCPASAPPACPRAR